MWQHQANKDKLNSTTHKKRLFTHTAIKNIPKMLTSSSWEYSIGEPDLELQPMGQKFRSKLHYSCITNEDRKGRLWCPTSVDDGLNYAYDGKKINLKQDSMCPQCT